MDPQHNSRLDGRWRSLSSFALAIFLAIAAFFLFAEHRAHFVGALSYLLMGVCVGLLFLLWRVLKPY